LRTPDSPVRVAVHEAVMDRLTAIVTRSGDRTTRAKEAAECICAAGNFRWVGLYDVTPTEIRAIAWTGTTPPAFPNFPRTQGLNGAAAASGRPVIVNDVRRDSRYLTTFSATRAEAVIPVRSGGGIAGTIDVESDRVNAFNSDDKDFLKQCALVVEPLWTSR
jgi:L-methionine (R)-S-oxide reductase